MTTTSFLKNKKGALTVQAMVAAALGLVLVMFTGGLALSTYQGQKRIVLNQEIEDYILKVKTVMNLEEGCLATLNDAFDGAPYDHTKTYDLTHIIVKDLSAGGADLEIAKVGDSPGKNWTSRYIPGFGSATITAGPDMLNSQIKSIKVEPGQQLPDNHYLTNIEIILATDINGDGVLSTSEEVLKRRVPVQFQTNVAGNPAACYDTSSNAQTKCEVDGYSWNAATSQCVRAAADYRNKACPSNYKVIGFDPTTKNILCQDACGTGTGPGPASVGESDNGPGSPTCPIPVPKSCGTGSTNAFFLDASGCGYYECTGTAVAPTCSGSAPGNTGPACATGLTWQCSCSSVGMWSCGCE